MTIQTLLLVLCVAAIYLTAYRDGRFDGRRERRFDSLREQFNATTEAIERLLDEAQDGWKARYKDLETQAAREQAVYRDQKTIIRNLRTEKAGAMDEMWRVKQELTDMADRLNFETNARNLYEQVVIEAAEQFEKNASVSPQTVIGVLRTVFVEAVATVESWRQGAPVEEAMTTNMRATMANRLLPDPVQYCVQKNCKHLLSEHRDGSGKCEVEGCSCLMATVIVRTGRHRDGYAGDSGNRMAASREHPFEYGLMSVENRECAVKGCGKLLEDPIHRPTIGWRTNPNG